MMSRRFVLTADGGPAWFEGGRITMNLGHRSACYAAEAGGSHCVRDKPE